VSIFSFYALVKLADCMAIQGEYQKERILAVLLLDSRKYLNVITIPASLLIFKKKLSPNGAISGPKT